MMNPRSTALIVTLVTASLAACGGGGGGAPQFNSVPVTQSSPTTSPTTPTSSLSVTAQEAQTLQALPLAGITASVSAIGSFLPGVTPSQLMTRKRMTSSPQCETETSSTTDSGETTIVVYGFNQPASDCSGVSSMKPEFQLDLSVYNAGSGTDTAHRMTSPVTGWVGSGLETFYNSSGQTVAQNTISYLNFSGSNVQIEGTFVSTGHVSTAYGLTCVNSLCSSGMVVNSQDAGVAFGSVISTTNGGTPTVSAALVANGLNELSLQQLSANISTPVLPFYQINPTSLVHENVSISLNTEGYTVTDGTAGATVVVTVSSDGAVSGVVEDVHGIKAASFSTDQFGNGTLVTSTSSTPVPIAGFVLI